MFRQLRKTADAMVHSLCVSSMGMSHQLLKLVMVSLSKKGKGSLLNSQWFHDCGFGAIAVAGAEGDGNGPFGSMVGWGEVPKAKASTSFLRS